MKTNFCVICGSKENLEDHHIIPKSKENSKYHWKNENGSFKLKNLDHPHNFITLCLAHHEWIHNIRPAKWNDYRKLTNEGRIAAMERGVKFGAKPKLTEDQIAEMIQKRSHGVLIKDLMTEYKLSKASVYRLMNEANAKIYGEVYKSQDEMEFDRKVSQSETKN